MTRIQARAALAAALLGGFFTVCPADVPKAQRPEVVHLIVFLRDSDCQMIRNGEAHSGADGAKHVQRKYDHFRDEIHSTEDFIEHAASKSTMSGKPYEVHCPGAQPVRSRDWLLRELWSFRDRQ